MLVNVLEIDQDVNGSNFIRSFHIFHALTPFRATADPIGHFGDIIRL